MGGRTAGGQLVRHCDAMSDWPPAEPPAADGPPGPGWWLASDGRYYPPEQAPGAQAPPPPAFTAYSQYGAPFVQTTTNGLAIASMVLGILWIYWIGSILARRLLDTDWAGPAEAARTSAPATGAAR